MLVLLARAVSPGSFGAFTLCFAIYTVAIGVEESVFGEPLLILQTAASPQAQRAAIGGAITATSIGGVVVAVVIAGIGVTSGGHLHAPLLALAVTIVPLLVHDLLRFAALAQGRPERALLLDALWVGAWAALYIAMFSHWDQTAATAWLAWSIPTALTCVVGVVILGARPVGSRRAWAQYSDTHGLQLSLLADFGIANGVSQIVSFGVAATAGLREVGGFRCGQALLGPANTLAQACRLVFVPELVRSDPVTPRGRRALARLNWVVLLLIVIFGGTAILIGAHFGEDLFGSSWRLGRSFVLPVAIARIGGALLVAPAAALRALQAGRAVAMARIVGSVGTLVAIAPGLIVGSAPACAWGMAGSDFFIAAVYWLALRSAVRSRAYQSVALQSRDVPRE
jgi:hypothetical protein